MAGLWSSCPCTSISWTPSFTKAGPPGGQGIKSVQCEQGSWAPHLPPAVGSRDSPSRGLGDRLRSRRTGFQSVEDNCCERISRRKFRVLSEEVSRSSRNNRFGQNAGFRCFAATQQATEGKLGSPLPMGATEEDAGYMRMAVQLARKAIGQTSPNPMVGCVIVKDGQIVGRRFQPKAGEGATCRGVCLERSWGESQKGDGVCKLRAMQPQRMHTTMQPGFSSSSSEASGGWHSGPRSTRRRERRADFVEGRHPGCGGR